MVVLGKCGCIRTKWLSRTKVVVFGQSGCNQAKVVVFGKSGCIWAKLFYSGKMVVFGQK